ncbi:MAG: hypothetical protein ACK5HP_03545 [Bacilli bacterium]
MYKAIIDRGETFLFFDRGTEVIDYKNDMMGFLINTENIIDLIKGIPISKYYVKDLDATNKIVTEKQAIWLYEQLINNKNGTSKNSVKKK